MKPTVLLEELEGACKQLAVNVSHEALAARVRLGGLCRVKGSYRVIIDKRATAEERATTLAEALARLDISALTLSDDARSFVALNRPRPAAAM
jgi:hypothetical protein